MPPGATSPQEQPPAAYPPTIGRIKSLKALQKLVLSGQQQGERPGSVGSDDASGNGGGAAEAAEAEAYVRGAKGQQEDMDRLVKLDWVQASRQGTGAAGSSSGQHAAVSGRHARAAACDRPPSLRLAGLPSVAQHRPSPLPSTPCQQELLATPGMVTLLTCGAMSQPLEPGAANGIDPDHLVKRGLTRWGGSQSCTRSRRTAVLLRPPPPLRQGAVAGDAAVSSRVRPSAPPPLLPCALLCCSS